MNDSIGTLHNTFWNHSAYLIIYLICMIILFVCRRKMKRGFNVLGWYSVFMIVVVIYNPIFMKLAYKLFFRGIAEYVRIFIILPVWLTIAYVMTELVGNIQKKSLKMLGVGICIAILMIGGVPFSKNNMYINAENKYKVSQDALEIGEMILKDSSGQAVVLIQAPLNYDQDRSSWYFGIRQYTTDIIFPGRFATDDEYQADNFPKMSVYLSKLKKENDFQYIICQNNSKMIEDVLACGYLVLGESGNHIVLKEQD